RAKVVQERSPLFVFFQILGDVFGDKNVSGGPASHHPLRHVEASTREIGMTVHIDHAAHRTAVHAHPKLQAWMFFKGATNFDCALRWRFLTGVEDQCHAVAGWNFYQPTRSFGFLVLIRTADDFRQLINYCPLLVNRKLRVTNNVDEQDMRDFEPNLLFNLGGHAMNLPEIKTIDNSASGRRSRPKVALSDIIRSVPVNFSSKFSTSRY